MTAAAASAGAGARAPNGWYQRVEEKLDRLGEQLADKTDRADHKDLTTRVVRLETLLAPFPPEVIREQTKDSEAWKRRIEGLERDSVSHREARQFRLRVFAGFVVLAVPLVAQVTAALAPHLHIRLG